MGKCTDWLRGNMRKILIIASAINLTIVVAILVPSPRDPDYDPMYWEKNPGASALIACATGLFCIALVYYHKNPRRYDSEGDIKLAARAWKLDEARVRRITQNNEGRFPHWDLVNGLMAYPKDLGRARTPDDVTRQRDELLAPYEENKKKRI